VIVKCGLAFFFFCSRDVKQPINLSADKYPVCHKPYFLDLVVGAKNILVAIGGGNIVSIKFG
jgi:hypothetical protein